MIILKFNGYGDDLSIFDVEFLEKITLTYLTSIPLKIK